MKNQYKKAPDWNDKGLNLVTGFRCKRKKYSISPTGKTRLSSDFDEDE